MRIEDRLFKSDKFLIRYCDESVEMNNIAVFRADLRMNSENSAKSH